jgi:hypothetical protein
MSDRITLSLLALLAVLMISFAAIWPQGLGARSPAPFGHLPLQQTPQMRAALLRASLNAQKQIADARAAAEAAKKNAAARIGPITVSPRAAAGAAAISPPKPAPGGLRPDQ